MTGVKRCIILLVLLLVAGPAGVNAATEEEVRRELEARDGSPISFYGHIFNTGRGAPMPMNTQFPEGQDDYSRGVGGACGTFNGVPLSTSSCEAVTSNEAWLFTTAGFVQVKNTDEWGSDYTKFHNERGQTKDIYYDLDQKMNATFWMSADWHGWLVAFCSVGVCWNWDPGYFEDWVVEATVYHGSLGEHTADASERPNMGDIYNNDAATIIAYGRDGPKPIASFDSTLQPVAGPLCGGPCDTVVRFDFDLEFSDEFRAQGGIVPKEHDVVVRFQWYQETDGDRYILSSPSGLVWNVNSGEDYPPMLVMPIKNPLDVELVFPRFIHDKLVVLSVLNTPWGSYDVQPDSIVLDVRDASGRVVAIDPDLLRSNLESSVSHAGHFKPIDVTWIWDYQKQNLLPGDYEITVKARNFQGSYDTQTTARFTIAADGTGGGTASGSSGILTLRGQELEAFEQEGRQGPAEEEFEEARLNQEESRGSPPVEIVGVLAGLAAAALLQRRRLS